MLVSVVAGESLEEFEALLNSLMEEHQPTTITESMLVNFDTVKSVFQAAMRELAEAAAH